MEQLLPPIHLACGDDENRPNFRLVSIKNGVATATDAHILVKIDLKKLDALDPERLAILEGKYIDKEVWKEIFKCDQLELDDSNIYCHKNGIKKTFDYSTPQGEMFNADSVVLDIKALGTQEQSVVCYSPQYITLIHKIFKSDHLYFAFSKGNRHTLVYPAYDSGMFAVLMQREIDTSGEEARYFFI